MTTFPVPSQCTLEQLQDAAAYCDALGMYASSQRYGAEYQRRTESVWYDEPCTSEDPTQVERIPLVYLVTA